MGIFIAGLGIVWLCVAQWLEIPAPWSLGVLIILMFTVLMDWLQSHAKEFIEAARDITKFLER